MASSAAFFGLVEHDGVAERFPISVRQHLDALHRAIGLEHSVELLLGNIEGQITNEDGMTFRALIHDGSRPSMH